MDSRRRIADGKLVRRARDLREQSTDAERRLWSRLRDRQLGGFKFRRQFPCEGYVLDFHCHEVRLAIELDGGQHSEQWHVLADEVRTMWLGRSGVRVLRFWNDVVLREMEAVLEAILSELEGASAGPHPSPLPGGEGAGSGYEMAPRADPHPSPLPGGEGAGTGDGMARPDGPHPSPLPGGEGAGAGAGDATGGGPHPSPLPGGEGAGPESGGAP